MFKALLYTRLRAMFSHLFRGSRLKKKRSLLMQILIGIFTVYVFCALFFAFGVQFAQLCGPFHKMKLDWLYFSMAGLMAFALMFIGSIFTTQTQLYEAKDNDLLLSMPIPPKYILTSRMVMLLILNFVFELLVVLPALVVYLFTAPVTAMQIVLFCIAFLLLPFLTLAFSCICGFVIALINGRVRNKSLVTMVLSICFLTLYFYFFSGFNRFVKLLLVNGGTIASSIKGYAVPVYWLGNSIANENWLQIILFALVCIIPFVIVTAILTVSFLHIATLHKGFTKIKYAEKAMQVNSVKTALLKKEFKHFMTSPMYMLNAGIGVVMILIGAVALIFKQNQMQGILEQIPGGAAFIGPVAIAALCALSSTIFITAPSVSLEGKNLWIAQSIPVDAGDILLAKIYLHLAVSLPAILFADLVIAVLFPMKPLFVVLLLILPIVFTIFCALFGLVMNLFFPRFDWISETAAVKQSMSSMLSMFGAAAILLLPCLLYFFLLKNLLAIGTFLVIVTVVFVGICAYLFHFVKTKGKQIFETLG